MPEKQIKSAILKNISGREKNLAEIIDIFKPDNLEDLDVGDVISVEGQKQRIYSIIAKGNNPKNIRFSIIAIYRTEEDKKYPNRKAIRDERYKASFDMLKRGQLNEWASLCATNFRKDGLENYRKYNNFLRKYEGLPEIKYLDDSNKDKRFFSRIFKYLRRAS